MNQLLTKIRRRLRPPRLPDVPAPPPAVRGVPVQGFDLGDVRAAIPDDSFFDDRWDREWLKYFMKEGPHRFMIDHAKLALIDKVDGKTPAEVLETTLTEPMNRRFTMPPLHVWASGEQLIGRNVMEVGCGPGLMGKQLGKVAQSYLGIDYSRLALRIAGLTCPTNCTFVHVSDVATLADRVGTVDLMLGRHFFIHQNFNNVLWLLMLAQVMLKPGGRVSADFYLANPDIEQSVVHPARTELDKKHPSCAFAFSPGDIEEVAAERGFSIASSDDYLPGQRRFVHLVKN